VNTFRPARKPYEDDSNYFITIIALISENSHPRGGSCLNADSFFFYTTERKTHPSFLRGWDVSDKDSELTL